MLVLSRRVGEVIVIQKDIRVVVLEVNQNRVRIGIDAPDDVPVYRQEVLQRCPGLNERKDIER